MTGIAVLGAAGVIANLQRVKSQALREIDESLELAASFGADYTRAIAPQDFGAYRYGGVSRSGTVVPNGITWKKIRTNEYAYGTPAPYGRRLELGFEGFDILGRYYNQAGQPHFGPSMDPVGTYFIDELMERGFKR